MNHKLKHSSYYSSILSFLLLCHVSLASIHGQDPWQINELDETSSFGGAHESLHNPPQITNNVKRPSTPPTRHNQRYNNFDSDDGPIQLVMPDHQHKGLKIVESSLRYLRSLEGPVATVAVVGKFHSGKSFLMNQLMGKSNGFGIGPSVQPKTMGIWMWGRPLVFHSSKIDQKVNLIFLDTEGFAANNVTENYDAKVFAVSTLLSSHLLYNSVKIIDQSDIDYLELLARRTQLFALRSQMSKSKWTSDFNHDLLTFPPLTWVVQDFVQETQNLESPTEWLHRLMGSHSRESDNYTISLLDIFERVDCHTLFIPAFRKDLLMDLSQAADEDLSGEYRRERDELKRKLRNTVVPKEKNDEYITGSDLAQLMQVLVTAANDGSLADVPSRWDAFVDRLQATASDDCRKFYETELDTFLADKNKNEPVSMRAFDLFHNQIKTKSYELLDQLLHGLDEALIVAKRDLHTGMNNIYLTKRDLNDKKIKLKCSQIKSNYEIETEELLKKLNLPSRTSLIVKEADIIKLKLNRRFQEELEELVDTETLLSLSEALGKSIDTMITATKGENKRLIEVHLNNIGQSLLKNFGDTIKPDNRKLPRRPAILNSLIDQVTKNSIEDFKIKAVEFKEESTFDSSLALFKEQLNLKAERVIKDNEQIAQDHMVMSLSKFVDRFRERTSSKYFVLPLNETTLYQRLASEATKVLEDFDSQYGDYKDCCHYKTHRDKLMQSIKDIGVNKQKENIKAFKEIVDDVLVKAKEIIKLSQDKYTTVFSFTNFVTDVCRSLLLEGKSRAWSDDLKRKVIDDFTSEDIEIKQLFDSKRGFFSYIVGFFEWLLSFVGL